MNNYVYFGLILFAIPIVVAVLAPTLPGITPNPTKSWIINNAIHFCSIGAGIAAYGFKKSIKWAVGTYLLVFILFITVITPPIIYD